jgi:hypothetical protein
VCVYAGRRHGPIRSSGRLSDGSPCGLRGRRGLCVPCGRIRDSQRYWVVPASRLCSLSYGGGHLRAWHTGPTSTTFCRSEDPKRLGPLTPHRRPRRPGGERHTHSDAQRPTSKITRKPSHTTPSDLTGTRDGLHDQPHVICYMCARHGPEAGEPPVPGAGFHRRAPSWNLMHGAACFAPSSFRSVWENSLRSQHSPTSRSEWLPQSCPTIDPS